MGEVVVSSLSGADGSIALNLLDVEAVAAVIRRVQPTHILHLAAISAPVAAAAHAIEAFRINVEGSLNLAAAAAAGAAVERFVFASTAEVYGLAFNSGLPLLEDTPPVPVGVYARTKLAAEFAISEVLGPTCQVVNARPSNHTGPGQRDAFVAPAFVNQIVAMEYHRQPNTLKVGDLSAQRDFLDVRDVAQAYLCLLTKPELPRVSTFNISSSRARPIGDIVEILREISGVAFEVDVDAARQRSSPVPIARVDNTLISSTGWHPKIGLRTTLADMLEARRRFVQAS